MSELSQEIRWFRNHEDELRLQYQGNFVVVKGKSVIATSDDEIGAIKVALEAGHKIGTFLVQFISPTPESEPEIHFSSRVLV